MNRKFSNGCLFCIGIFICTTLNAHKTTISHGLSFHDNLKYDQDFTHFDYANPNAPKGGRLHKGTFGSFDTFNTFSTKGRWADDSYFLYDSLMVRAGDEPYSVYGLIAERIEYPDDFRWVTYHLNPKAKFHDGTPITSHDVVFTFQAMKEKGPPHYQHFYKIIRNVKAIDATTVRFNFSEPPAKSLMLRLSQLRILPAHYWQKEENDLFKTTLKPPLSSGPYKISNYDQGHHVTYERVKDYWAANHPVNKGHHNFDSVRIDYYLDDNVALESFKKGEYDLRIDANPRNWSKAYKNKPGQPPFIQEEIKNKSLGMRAFVFNLRKPVFQERNVRKAISLALDFNWMNQHLFFGMYHQAYSLFSNSDLAATGQPSKEERTVLAPWRSSLPAELFENPWKPVQTDGTGNWRKNKTQAYQLLKEAGWTYQKKKLLDKSGKPLRFEILLTDPQFERFVIPFTRNLKELGIQATVKTIDTSQYFNRIGKFDFDMIIHGFYPSITPGTELISFWGSASADSAAGKNLSGLKMEVLDAMIDKAITAQSRSELILYARAIDRIVLWHHAVIPLWYLPYWPMVYHPGLKHPKMPPPL